MTTAYSHTTRLEILHPVSFDLLYTVDDTPVDFLPNLHVVLLGVDKFLSKFILNIEFCGERLTFGACIGAYRPGFGACIGGYKRYFLMALYSTKYQLTD